MKKYLFILALVFAPALWGQQFNPSQIQGGGSVDLFMQGGVSSAAYGTLTSGCVAITYISPNFVCVPAADATHNGYLTFGDWIIFNGRQAALSSTTAVAHQYLTAFTAPNTFSQAQPVCADLSDSAGGCSMSTTAGGDLAGTLPSPTVTATHLASALPIAQGGTGAGSAATAFANLAQTPTSPLTESAGVYACPTCSTGPNPSTTGGILGAFVSGTSSTITQCWFCSQGAGSSAVLSTDVWLENLTANISGSMNVGSYYSIGYVSFAVSTAYPSSQQFTINSTATAGAYQSPVPVYQFVNGSVQTALNVTSTSPTGGTAATLNFVTANVVGSNVQPLRWGTNATTVAGSTTVFAGPGQSSTPNATESLMVVPFPYAGTVSDLCFTTTGAQPSGGTLAATMRYGATFGAITNTTLTQAVPASAGAGKYCDHTHTVTVAAGGVMTFGIVNGSASTSATMNGISIAFAPSGVGPTAMIIFPQATLSFASGAARYVYGLVAASVQNTEAPSTFGMPKAGTGKNFYCYVTTAPGTSSDVLTVRQNLASPASGLTVTLTTSTTGIISDTSHTISFANKDLVDLQHAQSSGTGPAISACSMEID